MSLPDWMQAQLSRGKVAIQPSEFYMPSGATLSGVQITLQSGLTAPVISGVVGEFTSSLTVQGKVVIKDGDPVAVASGEVHIISGVIQVTSGTTLPVSIVSGAVASLSGLSVSANPNISGGVTVSGGVQVSGTVAVSGQILVTSGGTIPISVVSGISTESGAYYNIASSGVGISHYSGALNINISGGTISVSPFGYQSGTLVGISGGNLAMSGLIIYASGAYFSLAASGVGLSHYSGALNINISGGTVSTTPPAYQSGTLVGISGGNLAISGLAVSISGGAFSSNISGGIAVSGSLQVSGTVAVSGQVIITSGGTIPVGILSGAMNISGGVTVSGGITISGGVTVSGFVGVLSGGTIPVGVISGAMNISGGVTVSGGISVSGTVGVSGIIQNLQSGTVYSFTWPTYWVTSYWSGATKGIVGVRHGGGTAGQSGLEIEFQKFSVSINASGNINRFDILMTSGVMTGTAAGATAFGRSKLGDSASVGSGFVDGATAPTGPGTIFVVDSLQLEANPSGIVNTQVYLWPQMGKPPRLTSGMGLFVSMVSGIGIGNANLTWVERYP